MARFAYEDEELPGLLPWEERTDLPRPGDPLTGAIPQVVDSFTDNGEWDQPEQSTVDPSALTDIPLEQEWEATPEAPEADSQDAALSALINSADELSAPPAPEEPAYTPAAELPEDTSPQSFQDLGDESVDELQNASAEVAGIAESLRQIERDMGGTGEEDPDGPEPAAKGVNPNLAENTEDAPPEALSEESAWNDFQNNRRPYDAIGEGFRGIASAINPRQYGADWLSERNQSARQRARGDFDYQRQLRNEDRNETQEDQALAVGREDRARRISSEDEASARRRTLQGREDEAYGHGQAERSREEALRTGATSTIRGAIAGMLQEGGIENAEALVAELDSSDAQSVRTLQAYAQMGSLNQSQEASRQTELEKLRLSLEAKARRRGGSGPRRTPAITPGASTEPGPFGYSETELNALVQARTRTFRNLSAGQDPPPAELERIRQEAHVELAARAGRDVGRDQLVTAAENTSYLPDAMRSRLAGKFGPEEQGTIERALDTASAAWESLPDEESRNLVLRNLSTGDQGILSRLGVRVVGAAAAGRTRTPAEVSATNAIRGFLNLRLKDLSGAAVTMGEAFRFDQSGGADVLTPDPASMDAVLSGARNVSERRQGAVTQQQAPASQSPTRVRIRQIGTTRLGWARSRDSIPAGYEEVQQ